MEHPRGGAGLAERLDRLERGLDALAVPATYAALVDQANWTGLAELCTDDVVVRSGWGSTTGRDQTRRGFAARNARFSRQTHWLANQRLLWLDGEQALVECYFAAFVQITAEPRGDVLFRGTYRFELTWLDDSWRIAALTTTYGAEPRRMPAGESAEDVLRELRSATEG